MIGSTLTTILVFLPLAFVRGVVGQFFQSLSLSLTVALLVSMVVSLTIIPVLAARFLGRRPMPTTGPIYNRLADVYERAAEGRPAVPEDDHAAGARWLGRAGSRSGGSIGNSSRSTLETGFMPDMDEGAFVLDYNMPVGTSLAQTDKVMRRVEDVLLRDARRRGLHPPDRAPSSASSPPRATPATSWSASSRRASAGRWTRSSTRFARSSKDEVPELETEFVPLVQDQIDDLAGVESPIEVKVFGPDSATLRELAEKVGKIVEKVDGAVDVNTHVLLGNPDIVVRPDSVQTARVGLTELDVESQLNAALYGQVASTIPEQDRMTKIRVRYPDRVRYDRENLAQLPISLATATPPPTGGRPDLRTRRRDRLRAARASSRRSRSVRSPNELWRENQQPVITVTAELEERRPRLGQPRAPCEALGV